jgi:DNA repair ATPase RecN
MAHRVGGNLRTGIGSGKSADGQGPKEVFDSDTLRQTQSLVKTKMKKIKDVNLVSRTEMAEILAVATNRLSELKQLQIVSCIGNRYDPVKVVDEFIAYKQSRATIAHNSSDRAELESKLRKYKSVLLKDANRLERLREECGPIEDLESAYNEARDMILDELNSLPARIAATAAGRKELPDIADAIERVTHASLQKLATNIGSL